VHRAEHRIVDDIDGEFFRHPNVVCGVFEPHVGMIFDADRNDRRVGRKAIEKAEWSGIGPSPFIDRRHERDRARNYRSDQ
jgi:hypothetical protein